MGFKDRGARVGPRLLEGSGVGRIQEWVGVAQWGGQKGEVEGVGHGRGPQGVGFKRVGLRRVGLRWVASGGGKGPRGGP